MFCNSYCIRQAMINPIVMRYSTISIVKRLMLLLFVLCLVSMWFLSYYVSPLKGEHEKTLHMQLNFGQETNGAESSHHAKQLQTSSRTSTRLLPAVLVVIERIDSVFAYNITSALEANNIDFTAILVYERHWPKLEHKQVGKFSVVVFQSIHSYISLEKHQQEVLHQYCRKYGAGIITFAVVKESDNGYTKQVADLPVYMDQRLALKDIVISPMSEDVLKITKVGQRTNASLPFDDWTVFRSSHASYRPIVQASMLNQDLLQLQPSSAILHTTMLLDQGLYDGIQRIFIGNDFRFWLNYILFLDSISYLSNGILEKDLDRYIQVDIDDIFVGARGVRMTVSDVEALIIEQQIISDKVPGFTFNLGFSGKFFNRGNDEENKGDQSLVDHAQMFWWFPHMWSHAQPHIFTNETKLIADMRKNYRFSKTHNITVDQFYAIAPHHSGVYPTHNILYDAWRKVWGIKATSTEEYPALRPARKRKGFIFKDIMVLPRQTCGLFTHTIIMKKYPGGRERLESSIKGGELFQTVVNNVATIYMTHMTNYGSDRLALYTFDKLVTFIQKWTNLKLKAVPPLQLAQKYFDLFPEEREPLWTNPCNDKRHLQILPQMQNCNQLPSLLVIGPQKTGTTALYSFLSLHQNIVSNGPSKESFEELQFFSSSKNYGKGLEWYLSHFPQVKSSGTHVLFEKSATYFDSSYAPRRAYSLLPNAKLISILIDPAKRAYSWYQHERAHANAASVNFTFYEVITSGSEVNRLVQTLRNRCLDPGKYIQHLQKWLQYYPVEQLMILDGDLLKADPVLAMLKVQRFLHMKEVIDFTDKIIFDERKKFFCAVSDNAHTQCLGKSKGRSYPPMDAKSEKYLHQYFEGVNVQLESFLTSIGQPIPEWLNEALTET